MRYHDQYQLVTTEKALARWVEAIQSDPSAPFAFDSETTSKDPMAAKLVGISLAVADGAACYVPIAHHTTRRQIKLETALELLYPVLTKKKYTKVLHNAVYDMLVMSQYDVPLVNVEDTMMMAYTLEARHKNYGVGMDELAMRHMKYRTIEFDEVFRPDLGMETFADIGLAPATFYAAEDSDITLQLFHHLKQKLKKTGKLWDVYEQIDRPLLDPLAEMAYNGSKINAKRLRQLSAEWSERREEAKQSAFRSVDGEFNLGSPTELKALLFSRLGLPVLSYTDSGQPSTDADTLKLLAGEHEVAKYISEYRMLDKLIGTYATALPLKVNPSTGRVHTFINGTGTRTGRFSSSDPNCIHGSSRVYVLDERGAVPIKAIRPGDWVWSFGEDLKPIPAKVTNWARTAQVRDLIEVTVAPRKKNRSARRRVVLCTPDHLFRLRSGFYIEAKELRLGDSLLALERIRTNGYRQVEATNLDGLHMEHRLVHGLTDFDQALDVHHRNRRRADNRPENLELLSRSAHKLHHPPGSRGEELEYYNHEVVGLRAVHHKEKQSVYDITVDGTHNFVVEGVCVHNCQNIPRRTEMGKEIRACFIAPKGRKIVGVDYSQIELRVLAHDSEDKTLVRAFQNGEDIHAATASAVFGIAKFDKKNKEHEKARDAAKTVNFGLIYGQTEFGLSKGLGISVDEAAEFIATYFKKLPGVQDYIEAKRAAAREAGYVETLFGRRLYVDAIHSSDPGMRSYGERQSVNYIIQGTAADLMRLAMPAVYETLRLTSDAMLMLTVHDELLTEASDGEAPTVAKVMRAAMETCADGKIKWRVPILAEAQIGQNWFQAH